MATRARRDVEAGAVPSGERLRTELGRPGPRVGEAPAVHGHEMPGDALEPASFAERGEPANETEAPVTP